MGGGQCLAAVETNGNALQDVPETMRTKDLCLAAVTQDAGAFRYVPEQHRSYIIEQIGESALLKRCYDNIDYLPKIPDPSTILHGIERIVVTKDINCSYEESDAISVYVNHPKRQGKTVYVSSAYLDKLLSQMPEKNINMTVA